MGLRVTDPLPTTAVASVQVKFAVSARFLVTTSVSGLVVAAVSPLHDRNVFVPVGVPVSVTLVP